MTARITPLALAAPNEHAAYLRRLNLALMDKPDGFPDPAS
jgi:hypothetical protein